MMAITGIKAVIFDFDGTLLDTSEGVIRSVKYMLDHLGYERLSEEMYSTFIGPPIHHRMKQLYGITDEEAKITMNVFREHYTKEDIFVASHYEGMDKLLLELNTDGYKLGVCTYKREDMAKLLLEDKGLAEYFRVIHGQDAEGRMSKTEVLQLTMKDLGVTPVETVMVGDAYTDAEGATGAGAHFLAVTYGFGFQTTEDALKYPNIGIAETPEEIREILERL